MNARQRLTTALLVTLVIVSLASRAPALAQDGPSVAQYQGGGSGHCPSSNSHCVQSLGDGADAFSENVGQGTDALNEALEVSEASASASSASAGSVRSAASPTAGSSSTEGGTNEEGAPEGTGTITELPETGGASLAALGSGLLLATFGLMARRIVG